MAYQGTRPVTPVITQVDSDYIDEQRKRLGFTYSEIARRTNLNLNRVINVCQGHSNWNVHILDSILNILRLNPSDVISDKGLLDHYLAEVEYYKSNANGNQIEGAATS